MPEGNNIPGKENDIPYIELEPDSPFSFDIHPLRYTLVRDDYKEDPHRHNFQELIWIQGGKGRHSIDNRELEIEPRMFYLIARGQVHYFLNGIGIKGTLIRFTDDFFFSESKDNGWDYNATIFNLFTIHQSLKISKSEVARFEEIMKTMSYEYKKKAHGWIQILRHLLSILLVHLDRTSNKQHSSKNLTGHHKRYNTFISYLEQEYRTHHTVSYYAKKLSMTERHVSNITREFSGKTAKRLILERVTLEAKRYLKHTTISSKEIAYNLGFSDPSYFSKIFTQIAGQSPSSYRSW